MRKLTFILATTFAVSVLALGFAAPSHAGGDCPWGHSTKTAQSTPNIAQTPVPETKPSPGG